MSNDDERSIFEIVDDAAQHFRDQDRYPFTCTFIRGEKYRHTSAANRFRVGCDDGDDAAPPVITPVTHESSTFFNVAKSGGHRPDEMGLRWAPSNNGTYSTARTRASSSRNSGTRAMTTEPV